MPNFTASLTDWCVFVKCAGVWSDREWFGCVLAWLIPFDFGVDMAHCAASTARSVCCVTFRMCLRPLAATRCSVG